MEHNNIVTVIVIGSDLVSFSMCMKSTYGWVSSAFSFPTGGALFSDTLAQGSPSFQHHYSLFLPSHFKTRNLYLQEICSSSFSSVDT